MAVASRHQVDNVAGQGNQVDGYVVGIEFLVIEGDDRDIGCPAKRLLTKIDYPQPSMIYEIHAWPPN